MILSSSKKPLPSTDSSVRDSTIYMVNIMYYKLELEHDLMKVVDPVVDLKVDLVADPVG